LGDASESYAGREQTRAKHFILRQYLQALAFKVLRHWDLTYVDGFSGPWKAETADFSDTSFMIAIDVLKDAQAKLQQQTGSRRRIRCFFSESDPEAYRQLARAVAPHHNPSAGFEIRAFHGRFEDAVPDISAFVGDSFPLVFIDPTGWRGYPFAKIAPLLLRPKCEVLINFMYDFVSRFSGHPEPSIVASMAPILGGPDWQDRLDASLARGLSVEKLFRDTFRAAGSFQHVISTKIDKSTADRPHFFLAYGTKDRAGLLAFREIEYRALREHARNRSAAKARAREAKSKSVDLFAAFDAEVQASSIDDLVHNQKSAAKDHLLALLESVGPLRFTSVVDLLLEAFMLRETNVKDICVELSKQGMIPNTWKPASRKPVDGSIIALVVSAV
jgi:three-Cys-motif partner protein